MVRTKQGGSILGFVVVGGIMALLLVGGAYFVRHALSANQGEEPVAVEDGSDELTQSSDGRPSEPEDEPDDTEVTLPGQTGTDSQSHPDNNAAAPESLPQTGPADFLVSGVFLSSIAAAGVAYKRSRSAAASL